jgi:hypothetical protein
MSTPNEAIRVYLMDIYSTDAGETLTGEESAEEQSGAYFGEHDAWVIYVAASNMWIFVGYSDEILQQMLETEKAARKKRL